MAEALKKDLTRLLKLDTEQGEKEEKSDDRLSPHSNFFIVQYLIVGTKIPLLIVFFFVLSLFKADIKEASLNLYRIKNKQFVGDKVCSTSSFVF